MYSMNEEEKRQWIQERLDKIFLEKNKSSILALDLEINMLVCASQSYKHESVLKPFPSTLLSDSNNDKNYELLVRTLLSLPPVLDWRLKLKSFKTDQLNLVYWLLANRSYDLEYNTTLDQGKLKELSKYSHDFSKPTHVFEIKYTEEKEKRFDQLKEQTKLVLNADDAISSLNFHGTRMDNVYSIMHTGLLAHLNKNGLFGEGTYLSQEPSISLHYSPSCKSWENSLIGQRMSCLLVCETINDPKHVKIGINDQPTAQNSKSDQCKNSNNNLPEKYFIVKNNDYVRVRYLLIYAEKSKPKRKNKLVRLLNENRFALLLLSYSLLLIFVGLLNSRVFHKYVKLSYRKLTDYFTSTFSSSSSYE